MSNEKPPESEPTTEEILASIRRIISEGGEADGGRAGEQGAPSPSAGEGPDPGPVSRPEDEVLDLTERAGPGGDPEDVLDLTDVVERKGGEGLVSPATEAASAAAFSALAAALKDESRPVGDIRLAEGRTVEDLVGEILRPLIREWLDRNLPSVVERLVEREIRRMAGRAEGR